MALAANCLPPSIALREFWKRKVKQALKHEDLSGVAAEVADYLRHGVDRQIERLATARPGGYTLHHLDHFYFEERVRPLIRNGQALYVL